MLQAQGSEARLYTFSEDAKDHLRKFRLGTSRSREPQAVICKYIAQSGSAQMHIAVLDGQIMLLVAGKNERTEARRADHIDKNDHCILQDEPAETYSSLADLADALPENTPRYVLLSYPMTTVGHA